MTGNTKHKWTVSGGGHFKSRKKDGNNAAFAKRLPRLELELNNETGWFILAVASIWSFGFSFGWLCKAIAGG